MNTLRVLPAIGTFNEIGVIKYTDGYKQGHPFQYPEGTELVYSNWTARSSRTGLDFVIPFGLQYFLKEYLINRFNREFFDQPENEVIEDYRLEISTYLNQPDFNVDHVRALHRLGYLPLRIKALPEGSKVPLQVAMATIVNTKPEFFWVTNYIETLLSNIIWGPITSATTAYHMHGILNKWALKTVGNTSFVPYQGHDFSMRGMFGMEAACMSGGGHMTSFVGTDTIPAIPWLRKYYDHDSKPTAGIGHSVNATEHAVMCAGGDETELETFTRLLTKVYPTGILSIVSDTWDYFGVLTKILPKIKDIVMKRDGKLVIRPDSGDQFKIIVGYRVYDISNMIDKWSISLEDYFEHGFEFIKNHDKYYKLEKNIRGYVEAKLTEITEAEIKGSVEVLWDLFGGTETALGYKLLDSHIGCILGDGVTPDLMDRILERLEEKGFASYNMVFGNGSFTYQLVTRDTYGMAMKATFCRINGVDKEIFKTPKTDSKLFPKKSAKGLIQVKKNVDGKYYQRDQVSWKEEADSELRVVFEDSKLFNTTTLHEIRERIKSSLES